MSLGILVIQLSGDCSQLSDSERADSPQSFILTGKDWMGWTTVGRKSFLNIRHIRASCSLPHARLRISYKFFAYAIHCS